jgi:hypothetical protein
MNDILFREFDRRVVIQQLVPGIDGCASARGRTGATFNRGGLIHDCLPEEMKSETIILTGWLSHGDREKAGRCRQKIGLA